MAKLSEGHFLFPSTKTSLAKKQMSQKIPSNLNLTHVSTSPCSSLLHFLLLRVLLSLPPVMEIESLVLAWLEIHI